MAVARDALLRAARKRGIEGQVTIIRHFGIRCITQYKQQRKRNIRGFLCDLPEQTKFITDNVGTFMRSISVIFLKVLNTV